MITIEPPEERLFFVGSRCLPRCYFSRGRAGDARYSFVITDFSRACPRATWHAPARVWRWCRTITNKVDIKHLA